MTIRHRLLLSTLLLCVSLGLQAGVQAQSEISFDLERIQRATVYVIQARDVGDDLIVTCVGTGTMVNRSGIVLTNAHNTVQNATCSGETLVIALSLRLDEPPVPRYRASLVQVNEGIDLALLRIDRELDGRLINTDDLVLPFVELADSTAVNLDDTITIVGYPGVGDDPVSIVRGTVNGFTAEPSGGDRAWIKTSATIPGLMSGGGAYNQSGELIGIPTTAPVSTEASSLSCVWDTNGDGLVTSGDTCIPVGEPINALRPSNFARPLLRAAALNLQLETLTNVGRLARPTEPPQFRRLFFAPAVNDFNQPTSVLSSLPTGSSSLYLFFDYANMTPDTVYSLRVTNQGIPDNTFSLAPVRWSGGQRGMWYLGSNTQPWPNGVYEFTLFANGIAVDTERLTIGSSPQETPTFSDINFGLLNLQGNVLGNGFILPVGNVINAQFLYRNMVVGTPWTAVWYYEGTEFFRTGEGSTWLQEDGVSGSKTISISDPNGLLPGNYRIELYIEGRLSATSDFVIAGAAQEGVIPEVFSEVYFTTATTNAEARNAAPIRSFPATTQSLYAAFDWRQISPGTPWTLRWLVDGEPFFTQTQPWAGTESGDQFLMRLNSDGTIPDGSYRMELYVGQLMLAAVDARVGIGQLSIDRFSVADGALLRGQITDAATGVGISGASFVLISKEYSVADFNWDAEQIYAIAVTDVNGRFEIDRLLEFSSEEVPVEYSVLIVAEGYLPISADGFAVETTSPNPLDLQIEMTHD